MEGSSNSIDHRIEKLTKELKVTNDEIIILSQEQSDIFWEDTRNLKVFSALKKICMVLHPKFR